VSWIALPAGHAPAVVATNGASWANAVVAGWSRGYVEFVWDPVSHQLTPWASSDGLTWKSGPTMNTTPWLAYIGKVDVEQQSACWPELYDFEEGPGGLLFYSSVNCAGGCGNPREFLSDRILWTSSDGLDWSVERIYTPSDRWPGISGGPNGFVSWDGKSMQVSTDARRWRAVGMPAMSAGSQLAPPVSMAGGFTAAASLTVTAASPLGEGCVGAVAVKYVPSAWWSADGRTWTRETLPGLPAPADGVFVSEVRIDDHCVILRASVANNDGSLTDYEWISAGGRTWAALSSPLDLSRVFARDEHGLLVGPGNSLVAFDPALKPTTIGQTGSTPWWLSDWQLAVGPTGLLVTQDGTRFWLGVPSN
jgi:hypothetical protein